MLYTDTYYQNLYKFPLENGRKQLFKNGWEMCKAELTRTMDHHGNGSRTSRSNENNIRKDDVISYSNYTNYN